MGPNGTGKSTLASAIMGHPKYEITEGNQLHLMVKMYLKWKLMSVQKLDYSLQCNIQVKLVA